MTDNFTPAVADLIMRLISLPLVAMKTVAVIPPQTIPNMPSCTMSVPAARLLVAVTPHPAPTFADTLEQVSRTHNNDVLLIRSGHHPETIDAVTVDVALRFGGDALAVTNMLLFRHDDHGLWLVPAVRGPFVELTSAGLRLELLAPYLDADDRSAGLCRAAIEIARLTRQRFDPG